MDQVTIFAYQHAKYRLGNFPICIEQGILHEFEYAASTGKISTVLHFPVSTPIEKIELLIDAINSVNFTSASPAQKDSKGRWGVTVSWVNLMNLSYEVSKHYHQILGCFVKALKNNETVVNYELQGVGINDELVSELVFVFKTFGYDIDVISKPNNSVTFTISGFDFLKKYFAFE